METLRGAIYAVAEVDRPVSIRHIFYRMVTPGPRRKDRPGLSAAPEGYSRYESQRGRFPTAGLKTQAAMLIGTLDTLKWVTMPRLRPGSTGVTTGPLRTPSLKCGVNHAPWPVSWCRCAMKYVVPLFPSSGFSSLSFTYQAATHIIDSGREHAVILYVGDYDQAGVLIDKSIEKDLRGFLDEEWDGELTFHRLAVNNDQIDAMGLPTRPPKRSDTRSPEVTRAVEAEAIPAPTMRGIVSAALRELIPERVLDRPA